MARGRATFPTDAARVFIEALSNCGNITEACRVAKVSRDWAYDKRKADPEFAAQWEAALEVAIDSLEGEAWRRGRDGYEEYITSKDGLVLGADGRPVMQRRYSDALMVRLLQAHRPEKFTDRAKLDVSVTDLSARMDAARKRARGEGDD